MNTCQIFISKCGMDHKMLPKYAEEECYSHVEIINLDLLNSVVKKQSTLLSLLTTKYICPLG
jgi:hypothetical protein